MCLFWICEMPHLLYCLFFLQAFHKERKHALCHKNCLRFQKQKIYVKDYHFIVWLNGLSRDLFIHHIRFTTHWQVRFRTFLFQLWRFKTLNNSKTKSITYCTYGCNISFDRGWDECLPRFSPFYWRMLAMMNEPSLAPPGSWSLGQNLFVKVAYLRSWHNRRGKYISHFEP